MTTSDCCNSVSIDLRQLAHEISLEQAEEICIMAHLDRHNGNKVMAAKTLGISVRALRYKVKKFNMTKYIRPIGIKRGQS